MLRRTTALLPLLPLLLVAGCDRSTTEAEHGEPEQVELRDLDTGALFARTEGVGNAQTWSGELPAIEIGESIEVSVLFFDGDGEEIHLDGEYSANAAVATGGSGILAITAHGDHLDLEGLAQGTVQVRFQLFHGNHSDWESAPLPVTVVP